MPIMSSSPAATFSGTVTTAQDPVDILKALPESALPTTEIDTVIRSLSGSTYTFTYSRESVDQYAVTVDAATSNFTLKVVSFVVALLEDASVVLLEDGSSLLMEA